MRNILDNGWPEQLHAAQDCDFRLFNAKTGWFLDSHQELLVQNSQRRVGRQVQTVEAGVCARQTCRFTPLFYTKLSRPIASSERFKALVGDTWGSSNELKKSQTLIVVKLLLNHCPEPLDDEVRVMISTPRDFAGGMFRKGSVKKVIQSRRSL